MNSNCGARHDAEEIRYAKCEPNLCKKKLLSKIGCNYLRKRRGTIIIRGGGAYGINELKRGRNQKVRHCPMEGM